MSTNTARITALETGFAALEGKIDLLLAKFDPQAPAQTETAPVTPVEPSTKTLTRAEWQRIRRTKGGTVRKAFAGLTREQAHEAGLTPGYRLPTGELRKSLKAA